MNIKDRLRMRAGDSHKIMGYEEVCFSPLPLPTGAAPYSQYLQKHKTKSYLDFGVTDAWHIEDAYRLMFSGVSICLVVMFIIPFIVALMGVNITSPLFLSEYWLCIYAMFAISLPGLVFMIVLTLFLTWKAARQYTRQYPLRFNREKRQVCYIPPKGEPIFADWEKTLATISHQTVITPTQATPLVNLNIGVIEPYARVDGIMGHVITYGFAHVSLAVSEWEAIRHFMEFGMLDAPSAKAPKQDIEPSDKDSLAYGAYLVRNYPEGTPEFFDYNLSQHKKHAHKASYIGLVLWYLITFWKIPCYLAKWFNGLKTKAMPKEVQAWSTPIPKEQWVKPSPELLKQSAELLASYEQNRTFYQHFDIPFVK